MPNIVLKPLHHHALALPHSQLPPLSTVVQHRQRTHHRLPPECVHSRHREQAMKWYETTLHHPSLQGTVFAESANIVAVDPFQKAYTAMLQPLSVRECTAIPSGYLMLSPDVHVAIASGRPH